MTKRLCAYGDCDETIARITMNYRNETRHAFCCEEHAISWLNNRLAVINRDWAKTCAEQGVTPQSAIRIVEK
jgi:hypothetical protein